MRGNWKKLSPEKLKEAEHLYLSGLSKKEVADFCGVSRQNIDALFRKHGIKRPAPPPMSDPSSVLFYSEWDESRAKELRKKHASATRAVRSAIDRGILIPGFCEVCGTHERVQAHHDDYDKPLEVRWLCVKHHNEWHRENGKRRVEPVRVGGAEADEAARSWLGGICMTVGKEKLAGALGWTVRTINRKLAGQHRITKADEVAILAAVEAMRPENYRKAEREVKWQRR